MSKIDPSKTDTLEPFIIGQHPVLGFFAVPLDKETVSEEDLYTVLVYEENCVMPMAFAPYGFTSLTIPFVEGENYTVYWDGTSYSCQGWSAEIEGETFVVLGSTELAQWFIDGGNYAPPASEYPFMLAAIPSSYIFGEPGATIGLVVTAEGLGTQKLFGVYSDPNSKNILPLSEKVLNGFVAEEYFVSFNLDEQKEYRILWANSNFVLDQDLDFESGKIATLKDLDSTLNIGQKYYVVFNGNLYICTAFEDESNPSLIALGNRAAAITNVEGVEDTGEPFLFALHPSTKEAAVITKENYEIVHMTIIGIGEVQEYFCVPVNFEGNLALGNLNIIDIHSGTDEFEDSGEPFLIMSAIKQGMTGIATNQVNPIVLLGIYEHGDISSEEDIPDGIIIRDPLGRPITYGDYSKIILSRASGVKSIFSEGEAVSGNIKLDFKKGNMTVSPEKGKLWSKVFIEKPDGLIPENIAKGVTIAGIEGTATSETEELLVELNLKDGDQIFTPEDEDVAFSKVTIQKPDDLLPEKIVRGANIAGVEGAVDVPILEELNVDLNFSEGDMFLEAGENKGYSTVNIPCPEGLISENIAYGVTIAGIEGQIVPPVTEKQSVEPNFENGDMIITPSQNKLLSQVNILKPSELIGENIAQGIVIAGIEGTYQGGGNGETTTLTTEPSFLDYKEIYTEQAMDDLLKYDTNIGKYFKFMGESGKYVTGQYYTIIDEYQNFQNIKPYSFEKAGTNLNDSIPGPTEFAVNKQCAIGDLLIAIFNRPVSPEVNFQIISDGWELYGESENTKNVNSLISESFNSTLVILTKIATSTLENITIKYSGNGQVCLNVISLPGETSLVLHDCQYANGWHEDLEKEVARPQAKMILWCLYSSATGSGTWKGNVANIASGSVSYNNTGYVAPLAFAFDYNKDKEFTSFELDVSNEEEDARMYWPIEIVLPNNNVFQIAEEGNIGWRDFQVLRDNGGKSYSQVTLNRPLTLAPENIIPGAYVAGIGPGTGITGLPKLNQPTLSTSSSTNYNTLTITNPATNGNFAKTVNLYINNELVITKTAPSSGASISVTDVSLYDNIDGAQVISVGLIGDQFQESNRVTYNTNMYGVDIKPSRLDASYTNLGIKAGSTLTTTLDTKTSSGYMPITPKIKMGGVEIDNFTWDRNIEESINSQTSGVTIKVGSKYQTARLTIPNVQGKIDIEVPLDYKPQLYPPTLENRAEGLAVIPPLYAEQMEVFVDGEEQAPAQGVSFYWEGLGTNSSLEPYPGGEIYFGIIQDNGWMIKRLHLSAQVDTQIQLRISLAQNMYDSGTDASDAYLLVSQLDTLLSQSQTTDSSGLKANYKGNKTSLQTLTYDVPAGEHTIDIKYKQDKAPRMQFFKLIPYKLCQEKIYSPEFNDYNEHVISAKATSAYGLDSEFAHLTFQSRPSCQVENYILTVSNIIDSVEQIEVFIDSNSIGVFDYEENFAIDLIDYPYHSTNHQVQIKVTGPGLEALSSTITADLSLPAPAAALSEGVLTLSNVFEKVEEIDLYVNDTLKQTYTYDPTTEFSQDISGYFVGGTPTASYSVTPKVEGASYGFAQSGNYWVSQNKGKDSTAALAQVNFTYGTPYNIKVVARNDEKAIALTSNVISHVDTTGLGSRTATFSCINYAENNYDFGLLSVIDTAMSPSYSDVTTGVQKSFKGSNSSSAQTYSYAIPAGSHFVQVKYRKDGSQSTYNDTLQFRVTF